MARKDLLKGLMGEAGAPPAPPNDRVDPARPRYASGAIGAVSQSIAALKSRSVIDIDPHLIDDGGMNDRLEHDEADHQRLMDSLQEYGQQVPILVRPHPEDSTRYQIVYGRRRVLALRDLGLPAKAMIRDLDDRALVMAQGQENTARRDLSFIEKCNFARQMLAARYQRKAVCDALSIDKTLISRMISITDRVPVDLIEAIGSAPGVGRERWLQFANLLDESHLDIPDMLSMIAVYTKGEGSDARFDGAMAALEKAKTADVRDGPDAPQRRGRTSVVHSENGLEIGRILRRDDSLTLTLPRAGNGGFEDWLAENLSSIHRDWAGRSDQE